MFLPHQAWLMVDAIVRVAYRKLISGKLSSRMGDGGSSEERQPPRPRVVLAVDVPRDVVCDRLRHFLHPASTTRTVACIAIFNRIWAASPLLAYLLISRPGPFVQLRSNRKLRLSFRAADYAIKLRGAPGEFL